MHSHEPYDCELRSGGGCGSRGLMSMDPSRLRTSRSTLKAFEQTAGVLFRRCLVSSQLCNGKCELNLMMTQTPHAHVTLQLLPIS
jgi:hypothetical protein